MRRPFAVAAVALVAVLVIAASLQLLRDRGDRRVLHEREVARFARTAQSLATDFESGLRGYELSLDSALLRPAVEARRRLHPLLDSLIAFTAGDTAQRRRAERFRDAIRRWEREHADPALALPIAELRDRRRDLPREGKLLFDSVRTASVAFLDAGEALYRRRVEAQRRMGLVSLVATALGLLALGAVLARTRRHILVQSSDILQQQYQLEEQAIELEQQTDQAQDMAGQLEVTNQELQEAMVDAEQARHAVAAERQFLRALLDSLAEGIVACDPNGVLNVFNRATREMLGEDSSIPPEEWTRRYRPFREDGKTPFPLEELPLYRALQGETVRDVTLVLAPPDAPQRVTLVSGRPVIGDGGEKLGAVVALHDVTEKRALELQVQHAARLEAVGQLAGGVAHDFNNVLAAIRGFSDLLLQDLPPNSRHRDDVAEIVAAVDRAAALTRQLLAFSRRQILSPEVLDLNDVVERSSKMVARLLGAQIKCSLSLASDLGRVRADPGQIEQVIVNLAVNARDAMPDGGQLSIETANVDLDRARASRLAGLEEPEPGHYVMLAVTDTGVGMDRATQARIFEPFFTTKEQGKGTGLGLSTVFGIVKQSGGQVSVYSEPGRGTTFRVFLPRVEGRVESAPVAPPRVRPASKRSTVLVVDDDDAVRNAVKRMLAREGHEVLEAPTPREAEVLWSRHQGPIHLLVTDLVMPEMNGRELAERLLAIRPDAQVLFTSGYTPDVVARRGLVEPGSHFLTKPFVFAEFVDRVRGLLAAGETANGETVRQ